ncbi:zinc dependent phospholipase C family protein [Sulfurimonas sp.]|uniref:zinc dependent phospholipase C family protein n=1 Tax=Sulfurimonas sp. TaxID=2022749 RepID=UPI003D0CAF92
MAGTLTHFYVMKKYLEYKKNKTVHFGEQTPETAHYFLGATGPDIFYVGAEYKHISNYHHYKNVGLFIKKLYEVNDRYVRNLAKGFLSHMAADLVIHPFVNSLVGKYQEHLITSIEIPGATIWAGPARLSSSFYAHNMVEFAQDYYVQTNVFKQQKRPHNSLFTYGIFPDRDKDSLKLANTLHRVIKELYNENDLTLKHIVNILKVFEDDDNLLDSLPWVGDGEKAQNIEDHVDYVLDDEYKDYQIFLEHKDKITQTFKDEESSFEKLVDQAVELTDKLIKDADSGKWDDILQPWNLDTGLYTQVQVKNNAIKFNLNNYESILA